MKKLIVTAAAVSVGFGLWAAEAAAENKEGDAKAPAELEEKDDKSWEVGVDVETYTAYVWHNAISSDRAVVQPSVWGDWTFCDPLSLGFYVWQNYDLTNRRRHDGLRGEWNETDYNVHLGYAAWTSDDEEYALNLEFGHEWYTYDAHGHWDDGSAKRKDYPTTYEFYLKGEFENPLVTPYAQASWDYLRNHGMYFELGVKKEKTLSDLFDSENDLMSQLALFGDWNVGGGSKRYLTYLYAPRYVDDGDGDYDPKYQKSGIGGTTVKVGLTWSPCDNFSLSLIGAYTAILNDRCAEGIREGHDFGDYGDYVDHRNLVWGGFKASLSF